MSPGLGWTCVAAAAAAVYTDDVVMCLCMACIPKRFAFSPLLFSKGVECIVQVPKSVSSFKIVEILLIRR